ncbi:MAG: hypothetical protein J7497_03270, partial [Chitinophagaceae bacterium]|nr:hypothetical protein [Chitinophagaceae bacterium]
MYKKYKVARKIKESDLVFSLYLQPADSSTLTPFLPGQHLMFKFNLPGNDISLFRYFSFSDSFNEKYYRVSVKKEGGPCSSYIFDHLNEGDIVEAKDPQGNFVLDIDADNPVALFAGGIGITPLLCMIKTVSLKNPSRRISLFYGVNDNTHHAFKKELHELKTNYPSLEVVTFYKNISDQDIKGVNYDHHGLIDLALLHPDFRNATTGFYICGPAIMMEFISNGLKNAGIDEKNIHTESFVSSIPGEEIIDTPKS